MLWHLNCTTRFALIIIIALIQASTFLVSGQSVSINRDKYRIHITHINERIEVDGLLEENIWQVAERAGKFHRVTPTDTGYAIAQTDVMVAYDETNFYLAAICFDPTPGERPIQSLRRDFSLGGSDNFALFFDTFNNQTNGFAFYISAAGVQNDQIIYDGSSFDINWNTKWRSAVMSYRDRWVIEYSIPFRSLRYNEGDTAWGINFGRIDLKTNEKSAWAPMPRQFYHCDLAFTGKLIWDNPLEKSDLRFSLIPYITGKVTKNNQAEESAKWGGGAGFDTKVMLSNSLNLDITVNPDYSQVEEDAQRTNLDRFELFFPERRQFFLENSDLFASLGSSSVSPLFSRRIGLNAPVKAGMRLSGNFGKKWRIGLMDIQTGEKDTILASNYAVAVLQRQVLSRSYISAFFINKQVTGPYNDTEYHGFDFNRVAGLEYNLASPDNRLTGKAFYHKSFYPGASASAATAEGRMSFSTQYLNTSVTTAWVGANHIAEVGYIRRTGYFEINPSLEYTFFPSSSIVLSHGPNLVFDMIYNPEFDLTDRQTSMQYTVGFQNKSRITLNFSETFMHLDQSYDPTNTGGVKLPSGESFSWQSAEIGFTSDTRKLFTYLLGGGYGSYFNGTRGSINGSLGYKVQPYGSIAVTVSYNNISLPDPYNSAELVLVGPKLDITFTDKLFLTTFIQYNDQIDNLNLNLRFQWCFAPVSDLFFVYTSNSNTGDFSNKNHGIALKLLYWFN